MLVRACLRLPGRLARKHETNTSVPKPSPFPQRRDAILNSILVVCFVVFVLEIVMTWLTLRRYRKSFFFVMDFLGTVSVLIDITWVIPSTSTQGAAST